MEGHLLSSRLALPEKKKTLLSGNAALAGSVMFTRPGKACFTQLQKAVPEIGQFTVKQIGLGVFYREGVKVNKLLTSERLEEFKQAGEIADIEAATRPPISCIRRMTPSAIWG